MVPSCDKTNVLYPSLPQNPWLITLKETSQRILRCGSWDRRFTPSLGVRNESATLLLSEER